MFLTTLRYSHGGVSTNFNALRSYFLVGGKCHHAVQLCYVTSLTIVDKYHRRRRFEQNKLNFSYGGTNWKMPRFLQGNRVVRRGRTDTASPKQRLSPVERLSSPVPSLTKMDVLHFVLGNLWHLGGDARDFVEGVTLAVTIKRWILEKKDNKPDRWRHFGIRGFNASRQTPAFCGGLQQHCYKIERVPWALTVGNIKEGRRLRKTKRGLERYFFLEGSINIAMAWKLF